MSQEECRQTLGVPPDATAETIRQAYLDLARVWHPDRFQSDERLRRIAQERLREINEAYSTIIPRPPASRPAAQEQARAGSRPDGRSAAATATEEPPEPADAWGPPVASSWTLPRRFRGSLSVTPVLRLISNKGAYAATLVVLSAAPFLAGSMLVGLIRIPTADKRLIASQAFQPKIPSPMQVVDPNGDVLGAAKALSHWVDSEAGGPSNPARNRPPNLPATVTGAEEGGRKPIVRASRRDPNQPGVRTPRQAPPNGADLIPNPRQAGVGELRMSNHTGLEAVFKLVSGRHTLRAVYLAPEGSVTLRFIPIGIYDLQVDLGKDLDVERLQFLSDRKTLSPAGPFQFIEITSDKGISGKFYEVVVNPQ